MTSLTYSKNVFIPLTTVCSNNCSYCNFREPVNKAKIMNLKEIKAILKKAKKLGCKEVLFVSRTQPNKRLGFTEKLERETNFNSLYKLLVAACKLALKIGLLPHSNVGVVDRKVLTKIAPYNASMGLMLETTATVAVHSNSPTKDPTTRLDFIAMAGELNIPFTTGLLLGIGEDKQNRNESLITLKQLHKEYGHLQEIIIQPVKVSSNKAINNSKLHLLQQTIEQAHQIMPSEIAIQVPPNLTDITTLLSYGIEDLGGISPFTTDYINPDYEWPQIDKLQEKIAPIKLTERLPVHSSYLTDEWLSQPVLDCLKREGWLNEYK